MNTNIKPIKNKVWDIKWFQIYDRLKRVESPWLSVDAQIDEIKVMVRDKLWFHTTSPMHPEFNIFNY